jgi:hypothetical protein
MEGESYAFSMADERERERFEKVKENQWKLVTEVFSVFFKRQLKCLERE